MSAKKSKRTTDVLPCADEKASLSQNHPANLSSKTNTDSGNQGRQDADDDSETGVSSSLTSDELAVALQRTVDDLQSRLASLSNPLTNFAVKEFHVDTPVVMSMNDLGLVTYRLLSSSEKADPNKITRLSLTLVPIEKQTSAGALPPNLFKTETPLDEIEGLDRKMIATLQKNKIFTTTDLWRTSSRVNIKVALESMLRVDRERLANLLAQAELLLVKGIGKPEVVILFGLKIFSLSLLAMCRPDDLLLSYNRIASAKKVPLLTIDVAGMWVNAARSFAGLPKQTLNVQPDAA